MAIATGTIKEIENVSDSKNYKNNMVLQTFDGGLVLLEFRGSLKDLCDTFNSKDKVVVEYKHQGKKSSTGAFFNNLVATSIIRI